MRTSWRCAAAAAALTLALGGCASSSLTGAPQGQSAQQLLEQAKQQQGTNAAQTRLKAATILARDNQPAQALDVLKRLDSSALQGNELTQWALLTSKTALTQNDGRTALSAIDAISLEQVSPSERQSLMTRKGVALGQLNRPFDAATTLIRVQDETSDVRLNDPIWRQIARLSGDQLETLESMNPTARGWVSLARVSREQGSDLQHLFSAVTGWQSRHSEHPAGRQLPSDLAALGDARNEQVDRIAVFLPESGPLKTIADAIRTGMKAQNLIASNNGQQTPQLTFYDSSAQDIQSLYAQAAMNGAQLVVGPLDKDKVSQLETRPDLPITTLALNYGTNATNTAGNLYEYGLSAEDEARNAAQRAYTDGHRNAAVMVPSNDWGNRVLSAFQEAWQQKGGRIASVVNYDPDGSATNAVQKALKSGQTPDMLFLLALPSYGRQVPPSLDYYYSRTLPVYATSHIYQGAPQPRMDHDLNGVLFCDIPWQIPDPAVGGVDALPYSSAYQEFSGQDQPALLKLKAMGVDAYELSRRLPLFEKVASLEVNGATGTLHLTDERRFQRKLPWAQFKQGAPALPTVTSSSSLNVDETQ
ncbi:penicillin-binding protein activator [Larsenimonas suaedae]|uniref:Penicillin-binding protein activator n=1 Tax=Larsenimonas suaedae TaxID=1851019 RepID=A0ABU1GWP0_9GAMM|nr:penicillin-binding protein activator [Larsenimonas suaedae]MCM2971029.1 penicillin-binding protein activator [Larsenimonas suaedae]MDR5895738.1 penicillin-binding protein activator [Larsenimonas suaedae]